MVIIPWTSRNEIRILAFIRISLDFVLVFLLFPPCPQSTLLYLATKVDLAVAPFIE